MAFEWDDERKEYVEVIKIANINELGLVSGGGDGGKSKDYLFVMLTQHTSLNKNEVVIFDRKVNGTIPYDTTTGRVTLERGKIYRITLDIGAIGFGWSVYGMLDASTTTQAPEEGFFPLLIPGLMSQGAVSSNSRSFIFIPNTTRDFHIVITSMTDEESQYQVRAVNSSLTVSEI